MPDSVAVRESSAAQQGKALLPVRPKLLLELPGSLCRLPSYSTTNLTSPTLIILIRIRAGSVCLEPPCRIPAWVGHDLDFGSGHVFLRRLP